MYLGFAAVNVVVDDGYPHLTGSPLLLLVVVIVVVVVVVVSSCGLRRVLFW